MGAIRGDLKTTPLPAARASLAFDRAYSFAEFAGIQVGLVPQQMEDKWFIFFEDPWLYLHRSWTGYCEFQVRFEIMSERIRVAEALVSRDPNQYASTDAAHDASLLGILLDGRASRNVMGAMVQHITGKRPEGDGSRHA